VAATLDFVRVALAIAVSAAAMFAASASGWSDPVQPAALQPTMLLALPRQAEVQCRLATRLRVCPTGLPRALIGLRGSPPRLVAERYRPGINGDALLVGMSFSYGAPWEPGSGSGWRKHVWRNRPCCFLHFEIWKALRGKPPFPEASRRATLGGHGGDLAPSSGFGMACGPGNAGVFFCNHTRFRWWESGTGTSRPFTDSGRSARRRRCCGGSSGPFDPYVRSARRWFEHASSASRG
jgi:hypothetical protein